MRTTTSTPRTAARAGTSRHQNKYRPMQQVCRHGSRRQHPCWPSPGSSSYLPALHHSGSAWAHTPSRTANEPPALLPRARATKLAEAEGFEPPRLLHLVAFKATSFGRSDTPPPSRVADTARHVDTLSRANGAETRLSAVVFPNELAGAASQIHRIGPQIPPNTQVAGQYRLDYLR